MENITENIFWAGYLDWNLRNFHGYSTPYGSTYNSYLLPDDEPVLIDTVKHYGFEDMFKSIKAVIDPGKIKYIISNHTEMDHSGSLPMLLEICPQAQVVCSPKGKEGLLRHFKKDWNFRVVNTGDQLRTGKNNFKFFLTPMLHWPDSMTTYFENEKVLFSNDAFGQHYASPQRFVSEIGLDIVYQQAGKYYANIVLPYSRQVLTVLDALKGLSIDMICPSHGLIWSGKDEVSGILSHYKKWASQVTQNKVLIVFDTMWHSTEIMAKYLYDSLGAAGLKVRLADLQVEHISDLVAEILETKVVCFGTPVLNNKILPSMAAFLTYLRGLKPIGRKFFSFGSYGWSKIAFKELEDGLVEAGMEPLVPGCYLNYVPDAQELKGLDEVAGKIRSECISG